MTQPIFMVGARGCGKTTVGQALSQLLGYEFSDTDQTLLQVSGLSVAQIVEKEGWSGFRDRESGILQAVSGKNKVIATGGGIVLSAANRQFMRSQGCVIYLKVPANELLRRLKAFPEEHQRPSLTGRAMTDEIEQVLAQREALYQEAAHHVLDASRTPDEVVFAILQQLHPSAAS